MLGCASPVCKRYTRVVRVKATITVVRAAHCHRSRGSSHEGSVGKRSPIVFYDTTYHNAVMPGQTENEIEKSDDHVIAGKTNNL